ncbi:hypothetical protein ASPZODRAFT_18720 [Penicilliopsis zonata CBS 506.65]|uniref:Uncharacterized protein n=1 Tax=Penicilliopsis zonata CBS 506.65 TaxID=1073090 RepID=A0A1L9S9S3_9EURO|nr:hypothetical protein ASPZODRAFT_18720 [Penicilliopsis zonata CBS 506.65]OJJ43942.1 hypothetical protein ASPZODRAFT_18720 [Penicilliopsis zonata CBS 506.65]
MELDKTPSVSSDGTLTSCRTLLIDSKGIGFFRLPFPPRQLELPILDATDGSLAYVSTRERVSSGTAVLSKPTVGDLVKTEYFFRPGRGPIVTSLQADKPSSKVHGRWTSRITSFRMPNGEAFEWSYGRQKAADGEKANLIVLRAIEEAHRTGTILARLIRGEETRAPGSKKCSAGNGGTLVIDSSYLLPEEIIVATCLIMLEREIDRRRMTQAMMLSAAASGGP